MLTRTTKSKFLSFYSFVVGLYGPATMTRLPITNDTSGEKAVRLGPVSITGS